MFFKRKNICEHEFTVADRYYSHELTQYLNGADVIEVFVVRACKKCLEIDEKSIVRKVYPVDNSDSFDLKYDYLKFLKKENVKLKEEYLLTVIK